MLVFYRPTYFGKDTLRGMTSFIDQTNLEEVDGSFYEGSEVGLISSSLVWSDTFKNKCTTLVRWGSVATSPIPMDKQLNPSSSIKFISNKSLCRMFLNRTLRLFVPASGRSLEEYLSMGGYFPALLRPSKHSQGKNMWLVFGEDEVKRILEKEQELFAKCNGYYLSQYIEKSKEYRVFVVQGRVVCVAEKIPENPYSIAWNNSQGESVFNNVRWGDWDIRLCSIVLKTYNKVREESGLDFAAIDVIQSVNGSIYVLELNSAPEIPLIEDNTKVSYRQKCMAGALYHTDGFGRLESLDDGELNDCYSWKHIIHPGVWNGSN